MKRDLSEFSQVVQTDAVAAVSSTAAILKEKLTVRLLFNIYWHACYIVAIWYANCITGFYNKDIFYNKVIIKDLT